MVLLLPMRAPLARRNPVSLRGFAPSTPAPSDWVYLYNFDRPDQPKAIYMPQGRGWKPAADLDAFQEDALQEISRVFESEDCERHRREALSEGSHRRDALVDQLQAFARDLGLAIEVTPVGKVTVPLSKGESALRRAFQA